MSEEHRYALRWIAQEAEKYAYEGHTANHWQKVLAAIAREASAALKSTEGERHEN